ncbi:MAG: hypothetical protein OEM77_07220 [Nitrosopumilus sp.]|nr:hypothetical protein [Nitrosopumilus sp.]MDH3735897.1 hypothetical protein [Nitrosopumilus sp.]MDH3822944.1 hypothetical protein [Nitrosopumilus sp.]MDH3832922.1 hypothetical protein [Nitrosopumilus sp.]
MKKPTEILPVQGIPNLKTKMSFYPRRETNLSYRTVNPENCKHFPSLEMLELGNKRECILCKKILD